ncbi:hypothetical protein ACGE24_06270 [Corynebacterium kroppenstedtii]|uniref:arsenate reductase/protein-tyrosine-phosphatase family protein n=1 Tax=Corynebacterium sp. PCR 32 TaxID=3351342 RepID=UPI0030AC64EF
MKIVFVCTGNQCRSPVAEYIGRSIADDITTQTGTHNSRLHRSLPPTLEFSSVGAHANHGAPMEPRAAQFLANEGINPAGFTSTPLDKKAIAGADILVGMETEHVDQALQIAPPLLKKAATLRQLSAWAKIDDVHFPHDIEYLRASQVCDEALRTYGPDIPDPVTLNDDDFLRIACEVLDNVKGLVKGILQASEV